MKLPDYGFSIQSTRNGKYLQFSRDKQCYGYLRFTSSEVVSPYTRFRSDSTSSVDGLVDIRCCYNNRYWSRTSTDPDFIGATMDNCVFVISDPHCTIFRVVVVDEEAMTIQLQHPDPDGGQALCLYMSDAPSFQYGLRVGNDEVPETFKLIDWFPFMMIMPKQVAFRGTNGCYIASYNAGHGFSFLRFKSSDLEDKEVWNEIVVQGGSIAIRNVDFNLFWVLDASSTLVVPQGSDNLSPEYLFRPTSFTFTCGVLQNLSNNKFCRILGTRDFTDTLKAAADSQDTDETELVVVDLATSRHIYDVEFRFEDAKIDHRGSYVQVARELVSDGSEPIIKEMTFSFPEFKYVKWTSTVWLEHSKVEKITIDSGIPAIIAGDLAVSGKFSGEYEWGDEMKLPDQVEVVYKATVPPMTTLIGKISAEEAKFQVPFSYSHTDTLIGDRTVTYTDVEDGMYYGYSYFNLQFSSVLKE
ncbi:hypothetical protein Tsubulata_025495 [Turnera subulata]|uniref:Agglutinin domain-containing protein n=1 Tax=Turnera subulata TaxID=218843 RepID=A0A9Q0FJC9_9ROSI|nr:hypothetical protein Tsubulata_025495 [Turnera subulata]